MTMDDLIQRLMNFPKEQNPGVMKYPDLLTWKWLLNTAALMLDVSDMELCDNLGGFVDLEYIAAWRDPQNPEAPSYEQMLELAFWLEHRAKTIVQEREKFNVALAAYSGL